MFANKKLAILAILVLLTPMILTACGATPEPQVIVETVKETVVVEGTPQVVEKEVTKVVTEVETVEVEVEVEKTVQVEVEVTAVPEPVDRMGGWMDMMIVVEEPNAEVAAARLDTGDIDIYSYTVADPNVFETVKANDKLVYTMAVGNYDTIMFNFVGPVFEGTGKLNPFAVEEIRQAMNLLIDRNYIVQEIVGGLGINKIVPMNSMFPDYARYADVAKELEAQYAYDPEKAVEIIAAEMEALGAEMVDGKWQYEGEPVELIFLIRTEDERLDIGDYVSNLLEEIGFTVNRQYKTSPEASAIWNQTDPNDGLWHVYTAGWISQQISRDLGWVFDFYNSDRVLPWIRWSYHDTGNPEYDAAAERLQNNDFGSMEERAELFETALRGHMQYASEVMLFDAASFTPRRKEIEVTADLAAAVAGADLWAYTIRRTNEVGGAMTIAMPSILTEPWNPIAGTNWVYDQSLMTATGDFAAVYDPYTGLRRPQRLDSADVYLREGIPAAKTLDWVNLEFVEGNPVPDDAWVDWDAENQIFLTAGKVYTEPVDATMKLVCNYEDTLYDTTWHDGSNFSLGDVVMLMIMQFDQAKEGSAIYDEDQVPILDSFMSVFRGWRIASEDPLVVEYYTDYAPLDAENAIFNNFWCGYPLYTQGIGSWPMITLGAQAEAAGELTFSQPKSDRLEVEWMSFIGGPSLDILAAHLEQAAADNLIPYAPTMSQFVSEDEAATRWANYQDWYGRRGHFWIGNGPYYLEGAFPVEGSVILKHYADYPDPADKWSGYSSPKIAVVEVDGPGRVVSGEEVTFDVYITFEGETYPLDELDSVKYLVFDATGTLAFSGMGEAVEDGKYTVVLTADQTGGLEPGANRVEVIVASKIVSVPSTGTYEFVTE